MAAAADPALLKLRRSMGAKRYAALVREAHAKGHPVSDYAQGLMSGIPEGMIARTKQSLAAEASSAVGSAFAPAEGALQSQLNRADNLSQQRQRDMQAFMQWSIGQQQRFGQAALAAQSAILSQNQQMLDEQDRAHAAQQAALTSQQQFAGGGQQFQQAAQQGLQLNPVAQASEAAFQGNQATRSTAVTKAASDAVGNLNFDMGNAAGSQMAIAEASRQRDEQNRQQIVDQINELAAKKAAANIDYLKGLSDAEQQKAITKYQTDAAAALAAGKEAFQHREHVLDLHSKTADRKSREAIANAKASADAAKQAAKEGMDAAKFRAKYGINPQQALNMSDQELQDQQKKWNASTGKGGGIKPPTRAQARQNQLDLQRALDFIDKHTAAYSKLTPSQATKRLRARLTGGIAPGPLGSTPGFKQVEKLIANAALDIKIRGGLSKKNRAALEAAGVDTSAYPDAKTGVVG